MASFDSSAGKPCVGGVSSNYEPGLQSRLRIAALGASHADSLVAVGTAARPAPFVIRPSAGAFARRAAIGLVAVWPLLLLKGMVGSHQLGLGQWALDATATIATLVLIAAIYFLNVRIVVTEENVIVRGISRRDRTWSRSAVEDCVLISVLLAVRPTKMVVAQAAHEQFLFAVVADLWDDRALRALTRALRHTHRGVATFRAVSKQELLERYPAAYKQVWGPLAWLQGLMFVALLLAVGIAVQTLTAGI